MRVRRNQLKAKRVVFKGPRKVMNDENLMQHEINVLSQKSFSSIVVTKNGRLFFDYSVRFLPVLPKQCSASTAAFQPPTTDPYLIEMPGTWHLNADITHLGAKAPIRSSNSCR